MTTADRIAAAEAAIERYLAHKGDDYREEPARTTLRDVLADLMHWADEQHVDFNPALGMAEDHFASERDGVAC